MARAIPGETKQARREDSPQVTNAASTGAAEALQGAADGRCLSRKTKRWHTHPSGYHAGILAYLGPAMEMLDGQEGNRAEMHSQRTRRYGGIRSCLAFLILNSSRSIPQSC